MDRVTLHHGDCIDVLADLPDASVDAVVTDPPYGLGNPNPDYVIKALERWFAGDRAHVPDAKGFMGRAWDAFVPPPAVWDECLRVLKPGGHLLAFAGSRTYDLMTLSIRLAGFEIRDGLSWLYGSGFPKSLDVGKAIDRARDDNSERQAVGAWLRARREEAGLRQKDVSQHWPSVTGGLTGCVANWEHGFNLPTWEQWKKLRDLIGFGDEMDTEVWRLNGRKGTPGEAWEQREVIGKGASSAAAVAFARAKAGTYDVTAPATDAARQWQGWGTALKPAHEPIVMARKPLSGNTVAANVLAHGTGALNIEGCRVPSTDGYEKQWDKPQRTNISAGPQNYGTGNAHGQHVVDLSANKPTAGRWPSNVVLTHADCADECTPGCPVAELDAQSGISKSSSGEGVRRHGRSAGIMGQVGALRDGRPEGHDDSGGASRFFPVFRYQAKAPTSERPKVNGIAHPTCKPLTLMSWLVRLVTPPGGVVLDPFAGSGTTLEAAALEGFRAIGIEREETYLPLIQHRIDRVADDGDGEQMALVG